MILMNTGRIFWDTRGNNKSLHKNGMFCFAENAGLLPPADQKRQLQYFQFYQYFFHKPAVRVVG
jgi:hypothetical protein